MRFLILRKADADTERGMMPGEELQTAMGAWNQQLVEAGVMRMGEGLRPNWLIRVASMIDAIEWTKRNPYPAGPDVEVEIRPMYELDDLDPAFTPELREAEDRMRHAQLESGMREQLAGGAPAWR